MRDTTLVLRVLCKRVRLTSLDYRQGVTAVGAALAGGLAALPRRYGAVVDAAQCCHVGMVRWWRTF